MGATEQARPAVNLQAVKGFKHQLRDARGRAQRVAEEYRAVVRVIEAFGRYLHGPGDIHGMGGFEDDIKKWYPGGTTAWELKVDGGPSTKTLYRRVREMRNAEVHEGAAARTLTAQAVELALRLEDAMKGKNDAMTVSDYMVTSPVVAELWQSVSWVRREMLAGGFSAVPSRHKEQWWLITDTALVQYLYKCAGNTASDRLEDALVKPGGCELRLRKARTVPPGLCAESFVAETLDAKEPVFLVVDEDDGDSHLRGVVAAHDLLT